MCEENIYEILKSCNVEVEVNFKISKKNLSEELKKEENIKYLSKLRECKTQNINYNLKSYGFDGFQYLEDIQYAYTPVLNKYNEENVILKRKYTEEYYHMYRLTIRIPLESLNITIGNNKVTMNLVEDMMKISQDDEMCDCCINDEGELEFNLYEYNNVAITNFSNILWVMSFTKEAVEEVLVNNGITKAECNMEFEMHSML